MTELYPFQLDGISFLTNRERAILADEMGLGKTVQAICAMNRLPIDHYLVICPASLCGNWKIEIEKWSTLAAKPHVYSSGYVPIDCILIVSYGMVSNFTHMQRIMSHYPFEATIVDEFHFAKNLESSRSRNLYGRNGPFDKRWVFCLSGTPLVNKPLDIWPAVQRLHPGLLARNYAEFISEHALERYNQFSGRTEYYGSKNEEALGLKLSKIMLRREKSEVLPQLPPKTRRLIYLTTPAEGAQQVERERILYDDFLKNQKLTVDQSNAAMRVRVQLSIMKVDQAILYIRMVLDYTPKVLVFGWHREMLTRLVEGLAEFNPLVLTGATPAQQRRHRVQLFQTEDKYRVFIGAIPAAGVGLTLTAARHVIMCESSWVPGENIQAEDRAHRIGQTDNVLVDYLCFPNSVDEKVLKVVGTKADQISKVLRSGQSLFRSN